jgi:hypothetical protein
MSIIDASGRFPRKSGRRSRRPWPPNKLKLPKNVIDAIPRPFSKTGSGAGR